MLLNTSNTTRIEYGRGYLQNDIFVKLFTYIDRDPFQTPLAQHIQSPPTGRLDVDIV